MVELQLHGYRPVNIRQDLVRQCKVMFRFVLNTHTRTDDEERRVTTHALKYAMPSIMTKSVKWTGQFAQERTDEDINSCNVVSLEWIEQRRRNTGKRHAESESCRVSAGCCTFAVVCLT